MDNTIKKISEKLKVANKNIRVVEDILEKEVLSSDSKLEHRILLMIEKEKKAMLEELENIALEEKKENDKLAKSGIQIAKTISNLVNGGNSDAKKDFIKGITTDHRFLQGETFALFMRCIEIWGKNYETLNYDDRNAFSCEMSNRFVKEYFR